MQDAVRTQDACRFAEVVDRLSLRQVREDRERLNEGERIVGCGKRRLIGLSVWIETGAEDVVVHEFEAGGEGCQVLRHHSIIPRCVDPEISVWARSLLDQLPRDSATSAPEVVYSPRRRASASTDTPRPARIVEQRRIRRTDELSHLERRNRRLPQPGNACKVLGIEPDRERLLAPRALSPPERPWTHEYVELHRRLVSEVLDDRVARPDFVAGDALPQGYGVGFDERVVEFPWVFAQGLRGSACSMRARR